MRYSRFLVVGFLLVVASVGQVNAGEKWVELVANHPLIKTPFGLDFLPGGDAVLADFGGHRIVRITPAGQVSLIAGKGTKGVADGVGEAAEFNAPHNVCVGPDGMIYVSDTSNHRVRKIDPKTREVTTIAGSGKGFAGDGGPADKALFNEAYHVAMDGPEGLLVADLQNRRIRRIDLKKGTIATVVGNGKKGAFVEGAPALEAALTDPRACARGGDGSLWILERGGHCLRRVGVDGLARTVVGTGKPGPIGDGPASSATLRSPKFFWTATGDGSLWIADSSNHAIRRLDPNFKELTTILGTGSAGKGDVSQEPRSLALKHPHGVSIDAQGTVWVSDSENGRILRRVKE